MDEITARPTPCYRCGTIEDFPVLARIIEAGSGPGGMLYACAACARKDYQDHFRYCPTCSGEVAVCETARSMRELILAARAARAAANQ